MLLVVKTRRKVWVLPLAVGFRLHPGGTRMSPVSLSAMTNPAPNSPAVGVAKSMFVPAAPVP